MENMHWAGRQWKLSQHSIRCLKLSRIWDVCHVTVLDSSGKMEAKADAIHATLATHSQPKKPVNLRHVVPATRGITRITRCGKTLSMGCSTL